MNQHTQEAAMEAGERIILALDVDNAYQAIRLAAQLAGRVGAFKVGLELVNAAGIGIFDKLKDAGAIRIFYDAKLHDIPNTVAGAARAVARQELWMVNVHAAGGRRMIAAAADALKTTASEIGVAPPILLAVTLLTSLSAEELAGELHVGLSPVEYVTQMARMAQAAGAQGVVASPQEIKAVRAACGPNFLIVTPGVRPAGMDAGDQRRTMTPGGAVRRGADYLVVGRAVTTAPDPAEAAQRIAQEIREAIA
jgi:orotidine-5'-phosphate decarboxylase